MLHPRRRRLRSLSLTSMIPNMMTVIALCSGLTSIRFGLAGEWAFAAGAIVFAGVLDGLDGRLARALNSTTRFGAELDSLSDFVCFGVAPVVLLYQWTLSDLGGVGWI
ncbi:MAG: CDP-diacylglycerol O-phosphatidyltransferase, partial [Alphaproteobacteria bacterium]|nr:CDP-diacylglycerol O-phosphatidyltransferase [Alphaproteobacteria bacterium]